MKKYKVDLEIIYKRNVEIEAENIEEAKELIDGIVLKTNILEARNDDTIDTVNVDIRSRNDNENEEEFEQTCDEICEYYNNENEEKSCENCEHWCSICNECILNEE